MPGTSRKRSGMSTAPEASIILRSMTVIEAGASASGCCRRVALNTGGTWLRNKPSVAGAGSAACSLAGARNAIAVASARRYERARFVGLQGVIMGGSRFLVVSLGQPVAASPRGARILTDSTVFPQKTPVSGSIIAGWDSQMTHGAVPAAGPENKRPGWSFAHPGRAARSLSEGDRGSVTTAKTAEEVVDRKLARAVQQGHQQHEPPDLVQLD